MWFIVAAALIGYLLGSISFAVLVARRRGVDIFKAGSGNPGATNVIRVLGKGPGYCVFFLDFLKGFVAAHWPMFAAHFRPLAVDEYVMGKLDSPGPWSMENLRITWLTLGEDKIMWMGIAGLVGAVAGHSFSIFLRFRGGKGVATTIGGLMAIMPLPTLCALLVWNAVFFASKYVSLASILFGLSLMPFAAVFHEPRELLGLSFVLAMLILVRHRANLKRLMEGTEHKFGRKKATEATEEQGNKGAEGKKDH